MGFSTIGEEKRLNPFGKSFLSLKDWKKNKYYGKDLKKILSIPPEDRI